MVSVNAKPLDDRRKQLLVLRRRYDDHVEVVVRLQSTDNRCKLDGFWSRAIHNHHLWVFTYHSTSKLFFLRPR